MAVIRLPHWHESLDFNNAAEKHSCENLIKNQALPHEPGLLALSLQNKKFNNEKHSQ